MTMAMAPIPGSSQQRGQQSPPLAAFPNDDSSPPPPQFRDVTAAIPSSQNAQNMATLREIELRLKSVRNIEKNH